MQTTTLKLETVTVPGCKSLRIGLPFNNIRRYKKEVDKWSPSELAAGDIGVQLGPKGTAAVLIGDCPNLSKPDTFSESQISMEQIETVESFFNRFEEMSEAEKLSMRKSVVDKSLKQHELLPDEVNALKIAIDLIPTKELLFGNCEVKSDKEGSSLSIPIAGMLQAQEQKIETVQESTADEQRQNLHEEIKRAAKGKYVEVER